MRGFRKYFNFLSGSLIILLAAFSFITVFLIGINPLLFDISDIPWFMEWSLLYIFRLMYIIAKSISLKGRWHEGNDTSWTGNVVFRGMIIEFMMIFIALVFVQKNDISLYKVINRINLIPDKSFEFIISSLIIGVVAGIFWAIFLRYYERDDIVPLTETGTQMLLLRLMLYGWILFFIIRAGWEYVILNSPGYSIYLSAASIIILSIPILTMLILYIFLKKIFIVKLKALRINPSMDNFFLQNVIQLSRQLGLKNVPEIYWSEVLNYPDSAEFWVCSPVTISIFGSRSVIIFPSKWRKNFINHIKKKYSIKDFDAGKLIEKFVILHELSHIKNGDSQVIAFGFMFLKVIIPALPFMLIPLAAGQWFLLVISICISYFYLFSLSRDREYLADARATLYSFFSSMEIHFITEAGIAGRLRNKTLLEYIFARIGEPRFAAMSEGLFNVVEGIKTFFQKILDMFRKYKAGNIYEKFSRWIKLWINSNTHPSAADRNRAVEDYLFSYNFKKTNTKEDNRVFNLINFGITMGLFLYLGISIDDITSRIYTYFIESSSVASPSLFLRVIFSGNEKPVVGIMMVFACFLIYLFSISKLKSNEIIAEAKSTFISKIKIVFPDLMIIIISAFVILCSGALLSGDILKYGNIMISLMGLFLFLIIFVLIDDLPHFKHERDDLVLYKERYGLFQKFKNIILFNKIEHYIIDFIMLIMIIISTGILYFKTFIYPSVFNMVIKTGLINNLNEYDAFTSNFFVFYVIIFILSLKIFNNKYVNDFFDEGLLSILSRSKGYAIPVNITNSWYPFVYFSIRFIRLLLMSILLFIIIFLLVLLYTGLVFFLKIESTGASNAFFIIYMVIILIVSILILRWFIRYRVNELFSSVHKSVMNRLYFLKISNMFGKFHKEYRESDVYIEMKSPAVDGMLMLYNSIFFPYGNVLFKDKKRSLILKSIKDNNTYVSQSIINPAYEFKLKECVEISSEWIKFYLGDKSFQHVKDEYISIYRKFLDMMEYPGGGFKNSVFAAFPSLTGTYHAVLISKLLGTKISNFDLNKAWFVKYINGSKKLKFQGRKCTIEEAYYLLYLIKYFHIDINVLNMSAELLVKRLNDASDTLEEKKLIADIINLFPGMKKGQIYDDLKNYFINRTDYFFMQMRDYSIKEAFLILDALSLFPEAKEYLKRIGPSLSLLGVTGFTESSGEYK